MAKTKVLIVEDNSTVANTVKRFVDMAGGSGQIALGIESVRELVESGLKVDQILCDGLNGDYEKVKSLTDPIPFALLTSSQSLINEAEAKGIPAFDKGDGPGFLKRLIK